MRSFKLPSEKLAALTEAFEIAKVQRSFLALSWDDEFSVEALPSQVQLLLIKSVPVTDLAFINFCT